MDVTGLSLGSRKRLQRIMKLRNCNIKEALDFSISTGWLAAERLAAARALSGIPRKGKK